MVCAGHVHRNLANRSASTSLCRPLFCWLLRSDMYVLCFATWLLFCVRLWQIAVGLLYLFQSVCLCYWLQLAYYTYFCMSLWFSLCVSVTNYSWPTILISVCLCVWLQLTCYTYFCVSLWLTAVGPCPRVPHPGDRQQVSTVSVQTSSGAAG